MPPLSRLRPSVLLAPILIAIFIAFELLAIRLWMLDRRMTRELSNQAWRAATVIATEGGGKRTEVARLYGAGWRPSPPVRLSEIPDDVENAFVAAEDVRFRRHLGVDPVGIARAAVANVRAGGISQGGSTIPQQIVKQRFLSNDRTWRRKIVEGLLAVRLDARLSKDELLELYLSDVYLGHHAGSPVLGIHEASLLYFDKTPDELRVDEAALLAAMIRAPNRDTPSKRAEVAKARRDAVLKVMRERGWITEERLRAALERKVELRRGSLPEQPHRWYLSAVRAELLATIGPRALASTGLTIVCEIDEKAQRAAEDAAEEGRRRLEQRYRWIRTQSKEDPLQVAILSVDPGTGGIRALVGGSDFRRSSLDRTSRMRRQPGSAFKTFAYLAAIASKRATTASLLLDTPLRVELEGDRVWEPSNYDEQFRGRVSLREAFERSLNVPTVRLTQRVGLRSVADAAEDFGFHEVRAVPAMPLGVAEVTMRELTAAYTAFPNLGERVEPYLVQQVVSAAGETLYRHEPSRKRVVDAGSAYIVHSLLRGVVRRGTASRLKRVGLGDAAGKTGTTNDYRDAWFVGYTGDRLTTVWVGFDRGAPLRLSSSEAAIPIWAAAMRDGRHDGRDPEPPATVTFRDIDPQSGMLWRDGCPGPMREVFLDGTAPTRYCPRGLIGNLVRRVLFDDETFDEPTAITFEKFRQWTNEVDRNRQEMESALERLRRFFE
jgi:1A family penicillin-binding protein